MDCFVVHFRGPYNLNGEALIANGFIVLDHKAAKEVARYLLLIRFSNSEFQANFCICYEKKSITDNWVDTIHWKMGGFFSSPKWKIIIIRSDFQRDPKSLFCQNQTWKIGKGDNLFLETFLAVFSFLYDVFNFSVGINKQFHLEISVVFQHRWISV